MQMITSVPGSGMTRLASRFMWVLLALLPLVSQAQPYDYTFNSGGTTSSTSFPLNLSNTTTLHAASVSYITADEMAALGVPVGTINSLTWFRHSGSTGYFNGNISLEIWMENLDASFAGGISGSATLNAETASATKVLDRTSSTTLYPAATSAGSPNLTVPLASAFAYTGRGLKIVVRSSRSSNGTGTYNWNTTSSSGYGRASTSTSTAIANTASLSSSSSRPVVRFNVSPTNTNDVRVTGISNITSPGSQNLVVQVRNVGTATANNVTFRYTINGVQQTSSPVNISGGLAINASPVNVTVATPSFNSGEYYNISVEAIEVNGVTDQDQVTQNSQSMAIVPGGFTGNYTIDPTASSVASGKTYKTFALFGTMINAAGVAGPVNVSVVAGSDTIDDNLDISATGTSGNPITIDGGNRHYKRSSAVTGDRPFIALNGCSYVTIKNFDFGYGGNAFVTFCYVMPNTNNCVIENNTVSMGFNNNATARMGVLFNGSKGASSSTGLTNMLNNKIRNNTFNHVYAAVLIRASSNGSGNEVTGNTFANSGDVAVEVGSGATNSLVSGNTFYATDRTVFAGTFTAIQLSGAAGGTIVSNNRIYNPVGPLASFSNSPSIYLIYVTSNQTSPVYILNNVLYNLYSGSITIPFNNSGGGQVHYYHNTVVIDHPTANSTSVTKAFTFSGSNPGAVLKNNLIYINKGGAGVKTAIDAGTGMIATSDYNLIYVTGNNSQVGLKSSVPYADIAAWRGQTGTSGTNYDVNSLTNNPLFSGSITLPTPTRFSNDNKGELAVLTANTAAVNTILATDYNGETRPLAPATRPDFGAIEYTAAAQPDAQPYVLVSPVAGAAPGSANVSVQVRNLGAVAISSLDIAFKVNGVQMGTGTYNVAIPAGATSSTINLGLGTFAFGSNDIEITVSNVNGTDADSDNSNDVLTASVTFCSPLAGATDYTLNPNLAAGTPKNFRSFKELGEILGYCGVSGAVKVTVAATGVPFNDYLKLNAIPGASASNTVTIDGNNQRLVYLTGAEEAGVVRFNGADHVTLENLKIEISAGTSFGWGLVFSNQSDNNVVRACSVTVDKTVTSAVSIYNTVFTNSTANSPATSPGNPGSNNLIENSYFEGGYNGIGMYGTNGSTSGNKLIGNRVVDMHLTGILVSGQDNALVENNTISRPTRTNSASVVGISATNATLIQIVDNTITNLAGATTLSGATGISLASGLGARIERNRIVNFPGTFTSSGNTGITYGNGFAATAGQPVKVVNNIIDINTNSGTATAMAVNNNQYLDIINNTMIVRGASTTAISTGVNTTSGTINEVNFYNNIVAIFRPITGSSIRGPLYFSIDGVFFTRSNNNVLYMPSSSGNPIVGRVASTNYSTIAAWYQATGLDQNSRYADPGFGDLDNGDYRPTAATINDMGRATSLTGVTTDFTGATRSSNPDPGAYEFSIVGLEIGLISIDNPRAGGGIGLQPVVITVRNNGTVPVTQMGITFTVNGSPAINYTYNGNLAAGSNTQITIGQYNFAGGDNTLLATIGSVNGGADLNPDNNTLSVTAYLCSPLTQGTAYTIDKTQAASGTNFASIASFTSFVKNCGISGNVTVDIATGSGPYNEQFILTALPLATSASSLTINGNGQTITFTSTASARNVMRLSGVSNLTLNNLVVTSTGTVGSVINVGSNVQNLTISNSTLNGSITATSSTDATAVISMVAADANYLTGISGTKNVFITNNTLRGHYTGVHVVGTSGTQPQNIVVTGNTFLDQATSAVSFNYTTNSRVAENTATRPTRLAANYSSEYAFFRSPTTSNNNSNLIIENNVLHNPFVISPTQSSATVAFTYFQLSDGAATNPVIVRNNIMHSINTNGTIYGIWNDGSDNIRYENNTFILNPPTSSTSATYGYHYGSNQSNNITLLNNIFYIDRAGNGTKAFINYSTSTGTGIATANGNIYYVNPANSTMAFARGGTLNPVVYNTLAEYQTARGMEKNSRAGINPDFASLTDVSQMKPREKAVDNVGVTSTATTDYAGVSRGANIDAGAYQFTGTTGGVANDDCAAAQALAVSGTCTNTSFSTALANRSGASCGSGTRASDDDVWFSFTATSSNIAVLVTGGTTTGTLRNPAVELYSGSCGNLSIMACQNAETGNVESVRSNVTIGQTYYVRVYSAGEEQINAGTGTICILQEAVITSNVTGDSTFHSVVVKNGGNLTLPAATRIYYNLTVENGGILTLTGANTFVSGNTVTVQDGGTLNIANTQGISSTAGTGALRFATYIMGRANVNFTGTGNGVTGDKMPANVNNLTIAPGGGNAVTLTAPVNVYGTLTVTNGTLAAGTNALVLKSTAAGTAAVAPLTGGAAITGSNITAERWIPFYGYPTGLYAMVGTPITGKTAAAWANNGNTLTYSTTNSSVWDYDPTNSQYQGWVPQANGNMAATPGKGLYVFFRNGLQQQTSKITGSLFQGTTSQNLKYCPGGCSYGTDNGFNLIANPYAAPIDFDRVIRNNTDAAVYIFNHQRQAYITYVNGVSTLPGDALFSNGILASGQGFMVRANAADASVTFTESDKEMGVNPSLYRQQPVGTLRMKLAGAGQEDVAVVAFRNNATMGHDTELDAAKFPNAGLNLASFGTASHGMAINSIPAQISSRTELPLSVSAATSGSLIISLEEAANLPEMNVWLLDRQSGMQYPVTAGFSYGFIHNVSENGLSNRLFLVFEPAAATAANAQLNGKALLQVYPNPSTDGAVTVAAQNLKGDKHVLTVTDVVGRVMSTQAISATGSLNVKLVQQLPAGVYQIQLETNGERLNSRLVVK